MADLKEAMQRVDEQPEHFPVVSPSDITDQLQRARAKCIESNRAMREKLVKVTEGYYAFRERIEQDMAENDATIQLTSKALGISS